MFEFVAFDQSTIIGSVIVILALGFLRFGDTLVDYVFSYRSSPVEAVEDTFVE